MARGKKVTKKTMVQMVEDEPVIKSDSSNDLVQEEIKEEKPKIKNYIELVKNCMHNGKIYPKGTKIYTINSDYQIFKAFNER